MTTVLDILNKGTDYLEKRGIDDARRNMQWLVAFQLDCTRMDLYLRFDEPLEETTLTPLREALKKRGEGVPLQYLTGRVGFGQHEFRCDARALIPRPETEELATWLIDNAPAKDGASILDIGCGAGVLGLSLAAAFPRAHVSLTDLSSDALALAQENAADLDLHNVEFFHGNLFDPLPENSRFDLIVSNPPYVPEADRESLARELTHEPDLALFGGPDGLTVIRDIIAKSPDHLRPNGLLALEIGIDQAEKVELLMHESGLTDILTQRDLSGIPRFPMARAPRH